MSNHSNSISTRGILGGTLGSLGRTDMGTLTGENYAVITCQSTITSVAAKAVHANSNETGQITCVATATNAIKAISNIASNSTVSADAIKTFNATAQITCQSTLEAAGEKTNANIASITCQSNLTAISLRTASGSTNIISASTVIAEGIILINQAFIICSSEVTASATVKAGQKRTGRVDWENTLGGAPGPVGGGRVGGGGWVGGGMMSRSPTIAVTFIHDKHIYSDVKRRKKEISVSFKSLSQELSEIKVDLIKLTKNTKKPKVKMKADNGKLHSIEK